MKKFLNALSIAALLGLFTFPCTAQDTAAPQTNDWLLIPERRAGPITRDWTGADIEKAFGSLNCRKETIPLGEGETAPGYLIFQGTDDEIEVILNPETGKAERAIVRLHRKIIKDADGNPSGSEMVNRNSRWHSKSGITLGSKPDLVERVNGRPFSIGGWETDVPGFASWNEGNIPQSFDVQFMYTDAKAYDSMTQKFGTDGYVYDGASNGAQIAALKVVVNQIGIQL